MSQSIGVEPDVRVLWLRFLQRIEPSRPELHRYCRSLTGSVWDAEDLVQDTLLRAFARLGDLLQPVDNPKAYLLRVASNLWIDRMRRQRELPAPAEHEAAQDLSDDWRVRDAAQRLLASLSPQERAALVLKEVFEFDLAEIAAILETSVGAIKSALHGGRRRLAQAPSPHRQSAVDDRLVNRFVELFNARDLDGLAALLTTDAKCDVIGMGEWRGAAAVRDEPLYYASFLEHGDSRAHSAVLAGESVVLLWYACDSTERRVRNIIRMESEDGRISRLQFYTVCPETLNEVGRMLAVPTRTNGYGPWSPEFGALRKQPEYQAWIAVRAALGKQEGE